MTYAVFSSSWFFAVRIVVCVLALFVLWYIGPRRDR